MTAEAPYNDILSSEAPYVDSSEALIKAKIVLIFTGSLARLSFVSIIVIKSDDPNLFRSNFVISAVTISETSADKDNFETAMTSVTVFFNLFSGAGQVALERLLWKDGLGRLLRTGY